MAERFLIISFSLHSSCLYCQSCHSLAGMEALRANKKRKRWSRNEKLAKARVVKQQKSDKPEPVLREKNLKKLIRKIGYVDLIVNQLNYCCKVCSASPLLLTRCTDEDVSHLNLLLIVCQQCTTESRIIIHSS